MRAMVLKATGAPLQCETRATPSPGKGEILMRVTACAVCRTDLHLVDGELPQICTPRVPGHEIIGHVEAVGEGVTRFARGARVGMPWLGGTCGSCTYCRMGRENLCEHPVFTGYTRDGGYASHVLVDAAYAVPLPENLGDIEAAPLLCAGLIGWRCLQKAQDAQAIGFYGFGAAAHIAAQVARHQGKRVHAFTRPGDAEAQHLARSLGCSWAGGSDETPPEPLDAAIIFAPVGALIPLALRAVRKGGRVICGGIHMSDIPSFPYELLWGERELLSVANLTRDDAATFFPAVSAIPLRIHATTYRLEDANAALSDLRTGRLQGAAVLLP